MKRIFKIIVLIFILSSSIAIYAEKHLPKKAEIIESKRDDADFFGDYSYAAKFRIKKNEYNKLTKWGFNWFPLDQEPKPNIEWKKGKLPKSIQDRINGDAALLKKPPDFSKIYKYKYQFVNGGYWHLILIEENKLLVFYYHVSW